MLRWATAPAAACGPGTWAPSWRSAAPWRCWTSPGAPGSRSRRFGLARCPPISLPSLKGGLAPEKGKKGKNLHILFFELLCFRFGMFEASPFGTLKELCSLFGHFPTWPRGDWCEVSLAGILEASGPEPQQPRGAERGPGHPRNPPNVAMGPEGCQ